MQSAEAIEALDALWLKNGQVIRAFLDVRPSYERLAEEVAYILERSVRSAGVEYAHIVHRTKTLTSFFEKVGRKGYKHPLSEITDVGGVRITYLYLSDLSKLESIIENEFEVIEYVDKVDKNGSERFGYGALHYLVKLGGKASGARYDELKGLVCEVQVRTILQDAWAIVGHHLSYKQESDVPQRLRRKLNALSGLFETADDQFDRLKYERESYAEEVKNHIAAQGQEFLKEEINLENLIEYLDWRFPDREHSSREDVAALLSELVRYGYTKLAPIEAAVFPTVEALKAYEAKYPPSNEYNGESCPYNSVGAVRVALCFAGVRKWPEWESSRYDEFLHLIKDVR